MSTIQWPAPYPPERVAWTMGALWLVQHIHGAIWPYDEGDESALYSAGVTVRAWRKWGGRTPA